MTKEEYETNKAKILQEFGKPESDNHVPLNESARRLYKLLTEYRVSCRIEQAKKAREAGQIQQLPIKELATPELKRKYKHINIGELELNDRDLLPFSEKEQDVIRCHFEDMSLNHKDLAVRSNVSRQFVTALLDSPSYRFLEQKVFDKLMPSEVKIALLQATRGGDSKIIQRLAEHYKILNPEKMELDINKPIDDPKALQMLKELGDKLVDERQSKG